MTMKKLSCSSGLTGHLVPVKAYAQTRQRLRFSHTQRIDEDEGSDLRVYLGLWSCWKCERGLRAYAISIQVSVYWPICTKV